jgi:hypothetical protein
LGENIDTVQREVEALLDISKEDSLEAKAETTKYVTCFFIKLLIKFTVQLQRIPCGIVAKSIYVFGNYANKQRLHP